MPWPLAAAALTGAGETERSWLLGAVAASVFCFLRRGLGCCSAPPPFMMASSSSAVTGAGPEEPPGSCTCRKALAFVQERTTAGPVCVEEAPPAGIEQEGGHFLGAGGDSNLWGPETAPWGPDMAPCLPPDLAGPPPMAWDIHLKQGVSHARKGGKEGGKEGKEGGKGEGGREGRREEGRQGAHAPTHRTPQQLLKESLTSTSTASGGEKPLSSLTHAMARGRVSFTRYSPTLDPA
ncbi:MAG: hypothetical protein FRX49_04665 [Trebouxia sp. A1-2]|nr:MAG: hypothetical protein FRX49_04665 [Trebouxia sp. A1-2]